MEKPAVIAEPPVVVIDEVDIEGAKPAVPPPERGITGRPPPENERRIIDALDERSPCAGADARRLRHDLYGHEEVLLFTTRDAAATKLEVRTYDVIDLPG